MFQVSEFAPLAGSGDRQPSFAREVLPHLEALYRSALRLTHNREDAQDLVQETAMRAWRFFHHFRPGSNCRAWLFAILHNNARNLWRRSQGERGLPLMEGRESVSGDGSASPQRLAEIPADRLGWPIVAGAIAAALQTIPEDFRAALRLIDVDEQTYGEAAKLLGVPVGTVKSRVSRGRAMMRHALKGLARREGLAATLPGIRYDPRRQSRSLRAAL